MTGNEIRNCEDALRLLAAHLDGELDHPVHDEVERHISTCRSCYSRAEFEKQLKANVQALGSEPVPAPLSDRIHTLIRKFNGAEER